MSLNLNIPRSQELVCRFSLKYLQYEVKHVQISEQWLEYLFSLLFFSDQHLNCLMFASLERGWKK